MRTAIVVVAPFLVVILFGFTLKLLQPLIETRSHLAALALVLYTFGAVVLVGFVSLWLTDRLRPR